MSYGASAAKEEDEGLFRRMLLLAEESDVVTRQCEIVERVRAAHAAAGALSGV